MKHIRYCAPLFLAAALLSTHSLAQEASLGIAGYLNPATGLFTPGQALKVAPAAVAATAKLTVNFTVKLSSSIPLQQPVTCSVFISSFDGSFSNSASSQGFVTKTSATQGTCSISIPYVWQIAGATTNMNVNPSISTNASGLSKNSSATITPFAVPTTGTKIVAVTLAL